MLDCLVRYRLSIEIKSTTLLKALIHIHLQNGLVENGKLTSVVQLDFSQRWLIMSWVPMDRALNPGWIKSLHLEYHSLSRRSNLARAQDRTYSSTTALMASHITTLVFLPISQTDICRFHFKTSSHMGVKYRRGRSRQLNYLKMRRIFWLYLAINSG